MTRLEDLTEEEIARRLPVWIALADLYLDCEPDESDIRWIADTIRDAGYSLPEAESILRYEVAPAFVSNLLALPGGVWDLWLEDEVREMVLNRLGKHRLWERIPLWRDLWYRFQISSAGEPWTKVATHLAAEEKA